MKNKEPYVVIPQYLFDELIEYFDNKSDADNGTANKEMKILSQLQEEQTNIKTQMNNNKTLPKEIADKIEAKLNSGLSNFQKRQLTEMAIFGYSLRESKGCEWVKASERLPDKNDWYYTENGERYFSTELKTWVNHEHSLIPIKEIPTKWLSESNSTDELRKEVERLKGLLEKGVRENILIEVHGDIEFAESTWQQFKETHNL